MKERVDKLKDEVDTDDEDYQVVENSFVVPRGQKRKRDVDSDVGESGESSTAKREKLSLAADVVDTTAVDESIVESTDEPIVDTNADTKAETDTTETKDPAETTRETKTTDTDKETPTEYQTNERQEQSTSRGVLGTLFPFLL
jgi:hypothetical protein